MKKYFEAIEGGGGNIDWYREYCKREEVITSLTSERDKYKALAEAAGDAIEEIITSDNAEKLGKYLQLKQQL